MKKLFIILALLLLFCGCKDQTKYETISDQSDFSPSAPAEVIFSLPEGASIHTMNDEDGNSLYICDGYYVETYTFPAGDVEKTIQNVTGFDKDDIVVMERQHDGIKRFECSWVSVGEGDLQVCRAAVLDDGNYHYVLATAADQSSVTKLDDQWQEIFTSYSLKDAA